MQVHSVDELLRLARLFVAAGVSKLRLTGGEPTVRRDLLVVLDEVGVVLDVVLRRLGQVVAAHVLHVGLVHDVGLERLLVAPLAAVVSD